MFNIKRLILQVTRKVWVTWTKIILLHKRRAVKLATILYLLILQPGVPPDVSPRHVVHDYTAAAVPSSPDRCSFPDSPIVHLRLIQMGVRAGILQDEEVVSSRLWWMVRCLYPRQGYRDGQICFAWWYCLAWSWELYWSWHARRPSD